MQLKVVKQHYSIDGKRQWLFRNSNHTCLISKYTRNACTILNNKLFSSAPFLASGGEAQRPSVASANVEATPVLQGPPLSDAAKMSEEEEQQKEDEKNKRISNRENSEKQVF
jgi:hypothetical protein